MTTIAFHYESGIIAVESRSNLDGIIITDSANKIITNKLGTWILCGCPSDYEDLVTLSKHDKVDPIPECEALFIKDNKVYVVGVDKGGRCWYHEQDYNVGMGSGGNFALAAMDHGKSAEEAVKYAITRDIYSGGRVRVFNV